MEMLVSSEKKKKMNYNTACQARFALANYSYRCLCKSKNAEHFEPVLLLPVRHLHYLEESHPGKLGSTHWWILFLGT